MATNGKVSKTPLQLESSKEVPPERGHWTGRFDFILSCLGSAVGLGNVWRFPYLCFKNGGGAFLIPYILMMFLLGMPVFLLELGLGQYGGMGPLKIFNHLAPLFKGLGYAMVLVTGLVAIYYNMIIAWTLFYFFDSFRADQKWQYCSHDFNTESCFSDQEYRACKKLSNSSVYANRTCYNGTFAELYNISDVAEDNRTAAPEEYYNNYMLGKSDGIEDMGNIRWQLLLCLFAAWVVVVLSLIKGIKSSGRVVYFTATFPYVILFILFIRGVTLEGAGDGIYFYIYPNFTQLASIKVWEDAAIQVFYSFSISGGSMITYASYNPFHNNLIKDVLIIGIGDMLTSLFSGFVVFSMLGFMAKQLNKLVEDVVSSGMGLAFIAYPDAITRMPVSTLWALLFFFMLFLLGIDSQFAMVETIITFFFDKFPNTRSRKPLLVIAIGTALFLAGIPLTMNGGIYVFTVIDTYAAGWPYLLIGLLECVVVSYVYGLNNFFADLKEMTAWNPSRYIRIPLMFTIMVVAPILIAMILILAWIGFEPLSIGTYVFPTWGNAIGWVMAIVPITFIPIGMLHGLIFRHRDSPFAQKLRLLIRPTDTWRANARRCHQEENMKPYAENGAYDNPALQDPPAEFNSHL